jgi:type IV pilus assembly protein PilB
VFEVIRVNSRMADLIQKRSSLAELRRAAVEQGMKLLGDHALAQVRAGHTSLEEALSLSISGEA